MAKIHNIKAREILDARGIPTIEAVLWLDNGQSVLTSIPSGTSLGKYEAVELRDGDQERLLGKGVLTAVNNVNTIIAPQVIDKDPIHQKEIDQLLVDLDGTNNKSKLGANAILAVSQAVLKAGALSVNLPLYQYLQQKYQLVKSLFIPNCIYSIVNGGEHGADNLDIQEFQIIPASHIDYPSSLQIAATLQIKLEEILVSKGAVHSIGLLGGFTPNLYNNTDVFKILVETTKTTPYSFAQDVFFGIDAAASTFFDAGGYHIKDKEQPYSPQELAEYYKNIRNTYKVIYIEDPFQEDDHKSWQSLTADLGQTTRIAGDSFLVTNKKKIKEAIEEKSCNTVIIKPNQTGTISESVEVVKIAKDAGWKTVVSHRSGETADDFIADFAVGVGSDYAKFGPTNRGERIIKYNRLLQIYQEINAAKQDSQPQQTTGDQPNPTATPTTKQSTDPATTPPAESTPTK